LNPARIQALKEKVDIFGVGSYTQRSFSCGYDYGFKRDRRRKNSQTGEVAGDYS